MIPSDPRPEDTRHADRDLAFVPMASAALPLVVEVEKTAYAHPWSLKHFQDSLAAGHHAQLLCMAPDPSRDPVAWTLAPTLPAQGWLLGYFVAMMGVDEVHLLNITTVPVHRRQGWARLMLQALAGWARRSGAENLWLEVRESNQAARALYGAMGMREVGRRKGYYPDAGAQREDARVLCWPLATLSQEVPR